MQTASKLKIEPYYVLPLVAGASCLLFIVDGAIPQLQMRLLAGKVLTNALAKSLLFLCLALGVFLRPRINLAEFPVSIWKLFVAYLAFETGYFIFEHNLTIGMILQSFNGYYSMFLIAPAVLLFRGALSERVAIRWTASLLVLCAAIGIAQNLTKQPLLYTESVDQRFRVMSWEFFGEVRAFSLFSTALSFGIFCSLCGALGIALSRTAPRRGTALAVFSAVACYTTLTRNCYLIFLGACVYSAIITFGHKPRRGIWAPMLFVLVGLAMLLGGLRSYVSESANDSANQLQNSLSLIQRASSWVYYTDQLLHASTLHQAFGLGLYPTDDYSEALPLAIDNTPLALALHVGVVGLLLFSVLLIKMWLYLRQRALDGKQPLVIAAASLWATLACAGLFNVVLSVFGAVFSLAVLCEKRNPRETQACLDIARTIDLTSRSSNEAALPQELVS